jgi:cytochrome d ubiquinol oxidase subunit I
MRMELTSLSQIVLNPVAQCKFVHTVAAGYVTAATFVLGVSSWYLLRGRDVGFAIRSFAVAAGFGLASVLSVIVLGDESGYTVGEVQRVKLAVIEAEWHTQKPPAAITVFGIPDEETQRTDYAVKIPWMLGLIATRSVDERITGIIDLKKEAAARIRSGILAYEALQKLRAGDKSTDTRRTFELRKKDLGYGLLLRKYTPNVTDATDAQIARAAADTIPRVAPMFWAFRVMVGIGFLLLFLFCAAFYFLAVRNLAPQRWLMKLAFWSIPLPWIASEVGWFIAEYGRQPWSIAEVLPTFLSVSNIPASNVYWSLAGFVAFYTALLVVELYLMVKYIRWGPGSLGTGRYSIELAPARGVAS